MILDYNRVSEGSERDIRRKNCFRSWRRHLSLEKSEKAPCRPEKKGEMGLYLDSGVVPVERPAKEHCLTDPVGALDVAYLQREVLEPVWGITDPKDGPQDRFRRRNPRPRRAGTPLRCGLRGRHLPCIPLRMAELFSVADAGLLMPPKSTWFEPKLRSGLVHTYN